MSDPSDPFAPPPSDGPPPQPAQPAPGAPYGTPPGGPQPPPYGAPQYGGPAPYGAPLPTSGRRNGLGIAALVLGISSLLCLWWLVVPAILAIVFGVLGRGRAKRGEATNSGVATAGLVTGILGLLLGVVAYAFLLTNLDAFERLDDCTSAANGSSSLEDQCAKDFVKDVFGVTVE